MAAGCGPLLGLDDDVRLLEPDDDSDGCAASCHDDNPCTEDVCEAGSCLHRTVADGPAPESEQLAGDCSRLECVAGLAQQLTDDADAPSDAACATGECLDGEPLHVSLPEGVACQDGGGGFCDGQGGCVECLDDSSCSGPSTCGGGGEPGVCGCRPLTCSEVGQTCGAVHDGCYAELDCNNQLIDEGESDVDCGGPVESCPLRCKSGMQCGFGTDCTSGFCAAGACKAPWSAAFGDGAAQYARAVASDAEGNVVVVGEFSGTIDFGSGPLSSLGGWSLFVAKLGPSGQALWARQFGGSSLPTARDVAIDAAGNIVIAGAFSGLLDFGAGALDSGPSSQAYLAKLDDLGNALWSLQLSYGTSTSEAAALSLRPNGAIVVAGHYQGTLIIDDVDLLSVEGSDAFVIELTTAGGLGTFARSLGGEGHQRAADVYASTVGPVAVVGDFTGSIALGTQTLVSKGDWDVYVTLLDEAAQPLWSKSFGQAGPQSAAAVSIDAGGNVVLAGSYFNAIDLGSGVVPTRLDPAGAVLWGNRYGDAQSQQVVDLAVDARGDIVVVGSFSGSIDFGTSPLVSAGGVDVFVTKVDRHGGTMWSRRFGDPSAQLVRKVATTPHGGVVLVGDFYGQLDFGQGLLSSAGAADVFVGALPP
jgi:hypothetical protein